MSDIESRPGKETIEDYQASSDIPRAGIEQVIAYLDSVPSASSNTSPASQREEVAVAQALERYNSGQTEPVSDKQWEQLLGRSLDGK